MRNRSPMRSTLAVALAILTPSGASSTDAEDWNSDTAILLRVDGGQEVPGSDVSTRHESLDGGRLVAERPQCIGHCIHVQPRANVILWELQELPNTARSDGDIAVGERGFPRVAPLPVVMQAVLEERRRNVWLGLTAKGVDWFTPPGAIDAALAHNLEQFQLGQWAVKRFLKYALRATRRHICMEKDVEMLTKRDLRVGHVESPRLPYESREGLATRQLSVRPLV